mmetsp:Transcript_6736/g.10225  ORF Transcript_6736/g.10225 Transcript_6736/m.10225 type:complete len:262 (+) Transcript_6736:285-1070(+)
MERRRTGAPRRGREEHAALRQTPVHRGRGGGGGATSPERARGGEEGRRRRHCARPCGRRVLSNRRRGWSGPVVGRGRFFAHFYLLRPPGAAGEALCVVHTAPRPVRAVPTDRRDGLLPRHVRGGDRTPEGARPLGRLALPPARRRRSLTGASGRRWCVLPPSAKRARTRAPRCRPARCSREFRGMRSAGARPALPCRSLSYPSTTPGPCAHPPLLVRPAAETIIYRHALFYPYSCLILVHLVPQARSLSGVLLVGSISKTI